jgi:hypothetical protein
MSTFTSHFSLVIPGLNETGYTQNFNNSMQTIDSTLWNILTFVDNIANHTGFIKGNGAGNYDHVLGDFIKSPVAGVGTSSPQLINSTTYVDVTGSSVTYTPATGSTKVIYIYSCHLKRNSTHTYLLTEFFIDSILQNGRSRDHSVYMHSGRINFIFVLDSWTGAKTMNLQARVNAPSTSASLNQTYYVDGAVQNNNVSSYYFVFSI